MGIPEHKKDECFRGFVASAFVYFKKIIQGDAEPKPPTPEEAKDAYENDPTIQRCVEAILIGAEAIYKS